VAVGDSVLSQTAEDRIACKSGRFIPISGSSPG
jgi:hypothetical protein